MDSHALHFFVHTTVCVVCVKSRTNVFLKIGSLKAVYYSVPQIICLGYSIRVEKRKKIQKISG